jgi:hypothetical protein
MRYAEDIEDDAEQVEESIHEGSGHHTAEVFAEQTGKRSTALRRLRIVIRKVPLHRIPRYDIVD